jgi:26S proteasome regulatory subunit N2
VILLHDTQPDEPKSLLELKAKKKTVVTAPTPGAHDQNQAAEDDAMDGIDAHRLAGATLAAGVLNAVDEDEDGEEAPVPDEFEVDEDEAEE